MKITATYPPNIEDIRKRFQLAPGTAFTYGDVLYNPDNGPVDDAFMVHEETHMKQQTLLGVDKWWKLYLISDDFRLSQEVEAYQAQYKRATQSIKDRNQRNNYARRLAQDLSGPMYGSIITFSEALQSITAKKALTFDLANLSVI